MVGGQRDIRVLVQIEKLLRRGERVVRMGEGNVEKQGASASRDGMVPQSFFGAVHSKFRTPWKSTILTGFFVALMAALLPLRILAELVNIGTLLAFIIVCAAVLIMRYKEPNAARPFRTPFFPWIPILGIFSCLMLMFSLPVENWLRLFVWLLIGFAIYFFYSRHHSSLRKMNEAGAKPIK